MLGSLQEDPDACGVTLLNELQSAYPDRFEMRHLHTLQRSVQQWRRITASKPVHFATNESAWAKQLMPELVLVESGFER